MERLLNSLLLPPLTNIVSSYTFNTEKYKCVLDEIYIMSNNIRYRLNGTLCHDSSYSSYNHNYKGTYGINKYNKTTYIIYVSPDSIKTGEYINFRYDLHQTYIKRRRNEYGKCEITNGCYLEY